MVKDRPNTRYSDELKQKILIENDNGASVTDLSIKYGMSANTIFIWKRARAGKDNQPPAKDTTTVDSSPIDDPSTDYVKPVNGEGQKKITGESYSIPPDKSNTVMDSPVIKKKSVNGKNQTIQTAKIFMQSDSRYVVTIDFNRRRDVLREVETIADVYERTVEQQIIYMCKKMKESFE